MLQLKRKNAISYPKNTRLVKPGKLNFKILLKLKIKILYMRITADCACKTGASMAVSFYN